jgi:hypothetical protein
VTDFRRPDLDLWEEEDPEDGRPTIVSERPTAAPTGRATRASDRTIPFGTIPGDRKTPEVQRSGLVQRLIEQGALEDDLPRNSSEDLRDSEIDLLKLPPDTHDDTTIEPTLELVSAARTTALPTAGTIVGVESEPATDDQVPTVSVKRPLPPVSVELTNTAAVLPLATPIGAPGASTERDVTERISIPTGMIGSIAPATRTFRPAARERKGLPFWPTALAALVLLGGGISIAKFQAEQRNQTTALSAQPAREEEVVMPPPAAPEPAPAAASAPPAAPAPVSEQVLSPEPPPVMGPTLPVRDETIVPVSRTRRVRERTAFASAEPAAAEAAPPVPVLAPPAMKAAGTAPLPEHPSRDQVASSLNAVTGQLQKCVGDRHGLAEVTVTVRPAGFVSYAVVSGEYAGTSEGSCIARAIRAAKFPAFTDPTLRVTYPFQL